jgi:hypothetical protein
MNKYILAAGIALTAVVSAKAQTIADWTFETSQPAGTGTADTSFGSYAAEVGTGTASGFHQSASVYSTPAGNGSAHSFSSTAWTTGDYYQFSFSTTGFSGLQLTYAEISSSTGPGQFRLQYSTDNGADFTTINNYSVLVNASPNTWSSSTANSASDFTVDLSSITALDNQANVILQFLDTSTTSAGGGTVASGGTDRIDNVDIFEPLVAAPEQTSSLALFGLTIVGLGFSTRLFKKA